VKIIHTVAICIKFCNLSGKGNIEKMELSSVFNRLWKDYADQNPSVNKIYQILSEEGEIIDNDHIAFRTLDLPAINIDVVAKPFTSRGYIPRGEYVFTDKHLFARHYELPRNDKAPRVFISQLLLEQCSPFIRKTFEDLLKKCDPALFGSDELIYSGSLSADISYEVYKKMREESEYAAWFYVFGFRANHFTVSINSLKKHNSILKVNDLIKSNGFKLNSSGGEIKGTPADLLQQSSTLADIVRVSFIEGTYEIPSCYYEFAQRFPDDDGKLYSGFNAKSADKIFESTNFYKKKNS
jgi:hypothetical protein